MNYKSYFSIKILLHLISINIILYIYIVINLKLKIEYLLALYSPFDPFFNFFQFFSYMFLHSIHIFLHITFNMLILWICGIYINSIIGPLKFIIIYIYSGIIAGFIQNIIRILFIYFYTKSYNFYKISHIYLNKIHNKKLQFYMFSPIIGSSGAIVAIVAIVANYFTNFFLKKKIYIINIIIFYIKNNFIIFSSLSHLLHLSGALIGSYI